MKFAAGTILTVLIAFGATAFAASTNGARQANAPAKTAAATKKTRAAKPRKHRHHKTVAKKMTSKSASATTKK